MQIGLIGEHPNDDKSLINLLKKMYGKKIEFSYFLAHLRGDMLFPKDKHLKSRVKQLLRNEFQADKSDLVILIRDLDALKEEDAEYKIKKRLKQQQFAEYNRVVDKKGFFLLCIYELEAMILADIEAFNKSFDTNIILEKLPTEQSEPKEFLKIESKGKYNQSDNPRIFALLNPEKIIENCDYFAKLIKEINKLTN